MVKRRGDIGGYSRPKLNYIVSSSIRDLAGGGGGGSGDITGVTAGDGLTGGGTTGTVTVSADYTGTDSIVRAAADGTSITVASDDQMLLSDTNDSNAVKYVNVSQVLAGASGSPAGSDTQVQFNDGGAFGASANLTFDGTDLGVSAKIFHVGDTNTYINFTEDDINIQAGGVNFLDFTEDTQNEVTFNEGGVDIDFRVETADESHMLFIEGSSNRMSIGDNTGSPGATLEVKNHASAGATGVPLVQLNSNCVDQLALDINASNTTVNVVDILANDVTSAKVLNIGADGLTTGNALYVDDNSADTGTRNTAIVIQNDAAAIAATALHVQSDGGVTGISLDKNYSDTTEASISGLIIDFDKNGASVSDNTMYGIQVDMDNTTANDGNNYMYGLYVTPRLTHADNAGLAAVYGAHIDATAGTNGSGVAQAAYFKASGGTVSHGILIDCENGASNFDFRIRSSANNKDHFTIQVGASGETTFDTNDFGGQNAHLSCSIDGEMILDPYTVVRVLDDKKLTFGDSDDAYIEYDEDSSDNLILSASVFTVSSSTLSLKDGLVSGLGNLSGPALEFSGNWNKADIRYASYYDKFYFASAGLWLADNEKIFLGSISGGDFELFHDGTNSIIQNDTGDLQISGTAGNIMISGSHGVNVSGSSIYLESTGDVHVTGSNIMLSGAAVEAVTQGLYIIGEPDGQGAKLYMWADQGDDTNDKATISKPNNGGSIIIQNYGGVEIENPGASGDSCLLLDNQDTDEYALEIAASNITYDVVNITADAVTTAKGLSITASALTTGQALHIDHNDTATAAVTPTSVWVDFDKSGVTGDSVTSAYTGFDLDMNDAATNNANAAVEMVGLDIDVASANAQGTIHNTGSSISVTGGDYNVGLEITTTDANPAASQDIKIMSSADPGDYFSISTYTAGLTTFTTVDDGGAEADIVFAPDGVVRINDNINLAFGHNEDAYIKYDETTSDKLIMSGAHGGTYFSGSSIHVGALGAAGTTYGPSITTPVTAFDTITDMGTQSSQGDAIAKIADGQGGGDMVRLGAFDSGVVKGHVLSLYRQGWYEADRSDTSANGDSTRMLGVAMDDDGGDDEGLVLLRGIVRIDAALMNNYAGVTDVGDPVYLSTIAGEYDMHPSTTSGDVVRILGYLIDTDGTDFLIYFNPDNTFVTIA